MIRSIRKFIAQGPQNQNIFNKNLMEKILEYNFIGNYNYAYLLNDLGIDSTT